MRPLFTNGISFLLLTFCTASFCTGDDTLRLDLELVNDLDSYTLNVGDFSMHDGLKISIHVTNSTSKQMTFSITPSCSCAKIGESEVAISKSQSKEINLSIGRVLAQQAVEFSLRLRDQDTGDIKMIGVKGNALPPVHVKEHQISVKSSSTSEEEITLLSHFDHIHIENIVAVGDDYACLVNRLSPRESKVLIRPVKTWRGSNVVFNVKMSDGREDFVFVPVVFSDRVNFVTREVVFDRKSEGKDFSTRIIVQTGSDSPDPKEWKIKLFQDGAEVSDLRIEEVRVRTKRVLVIGLSFGCELLSKQDGLEVKFSNISDRWEKTIPARIEGKSNEKP